MSNLNAIVTAGGSGIGRVVAEQLTARGDRVFICDATAESVRDAVSQPGIAGGVVADVTSEADVDRLMDEALHTLGSVDLLINTAGTAGPTSPVEDIALADWQQCIAVTLDGTFLCTRLVAPIMKAQQSGSIINFSSTAGLFGYPNRTPYAAAKWGVIGFTKSLAMELGPHGIRVNAICPGAVGGERMDRVIAAEALATGRTESAVREGYKRCTSLRTFVSAEDIANTILFLTSPAGARISGQSLAVDGHTESMGC